MTKEMKHNYQNSKIKGFPIWYVFATNRNPLNYLILSATGVLHLP